MNTQNTSGTGGSAGGSGGGGGNAGAPRVTNVSAFKVVVKNGLYFHHLLQRYSFFVPPRIIMFLPRRCFSSCNKDIGYLKEQESLLHQNLNWQLNSAQLPMQQLQTVSLLLLLLFTKYTAKEFD